MALLQHGLARCQEGPLHSGSARQDPLRFKGPNRRGCGGSQGDPHSFQGVACQLHIGRDAQQRQIHGVPASVLDVKTAGVGGRRRNPDTGQQLIRPQIQLFQAQVEIVEGDLPLSSRASSHYPGIVDQHGADAVRRGRAVADVAPQRPPGADLDRAHPGAALEHGPIVLLDHIPQLDLPMGGQGAQIQPLCLVKGMSLQGGNVLDVHHLAGAVLSPVHIDKHIRAAGHHLGALRFQAAGLLHGVRHIEFKLRKHGRAPF